MVVGDLMNRPAPTAQNYIGCLVAAIMIGASWGLMIGAGVLVYRILT